MANILGIGVATLDIINTVAAYPPEDTKTRAETQRLCRGGNATNTLVVLSQLGHRCSWGGTLAEEPNAAYIRQDLQRYGVDLEPSRCYPAGRVPVSYVTVSRATGSRTVVHYRDLPEYSFADFASLSLQAYDWLHFEGRAVAETRRMLAAARRAGVAISLEIEQARADIEDLLPYADVLLFARAYAEHAGYTDGAEFLRAMRPLAPQAQLVCAWGAAGAYSLDRRGRACHAPAQRPAQVVDTLGAGDTFNAAVIDARIQGADLAAAVGAGVALAGRKCGHEGLHDLLARPAAPDGAVR